MIINLRKLDYILIAIIILLYLGTTLIENYVGHPTMRFLGPLLILVLVIVYLQTIRSLEQEFRKIKMASRKEILKNIDEVDTKIDDALSREEASKREIEYLKSVIKDVEEHIVSEVRNKSVYKQVIETVEQNLVREIRNKTEFQQVMKAAEENLAGMIRDKSGLEQVIRVVEENLIREIKDHSEIGSFLKSTEDNLTREIKNHEAMQQIIKKAEDRMVKEILNRTDNLYLQLDSLMAVNRILQDVRHPLQPFRGWAISPDFARILMTQILVQKPGVVFELGSGVSTLITGYCLKMNGGGKLISLEHEEKYYQSTLQNIQAHGLREFVSLYYAPLKNYTLEGTVHAWYDLAEVPLDQPVDLLTVDGPPGAIQKESRFPAYPLLQPYLNDNAVILVDDYIREDEKEMVKRWLQDERLKQVEIINTEKMTCVLRLNRTTLT